MKVIPSQENHYYWGDGCEGWRLLNEKSISIIKEIIPPGKGEKMHLHTAVLQFFFILSGKAKFIIEEKEYFIAAGEGIKIEPGKKHSISNQSEQNLEFILSSQPSVGNDRINEDEK